MSEQHNYWQIACGSSQRDYSAKFLEFGMAFVGDKRNVEIMQTVSVGDRIILKGGTSQVLAVGEVVQRYGKHVGENDKDWLRDFDGWDLRGYCYVDWRKPPSPIPAKGLGRRTIEQVHNPQLREMADKIIASKRVHERSPEPGLTKRVDDDEILEFLVNVGLRPTAAADLSDTFKSIRLLANYYYSGGVLTKEEKDKNWRFYWGDVREHETRTFLVIPLLLALGWSEKQMKIELPVKGRCRADIACFARPYRISEHREGCVMVIETKGFEQGLDWAGSQAEAYAANFPHCRTIVVSNGYCYKVYTRNGDKGDSWPLAAYLNIRQPRDRYPLDPDHVKGCLEAFRLLLPYAVQREIADSEQ